jgi:arsenate reductase
MAASSLAKHLGDEHAVYSAGTEPADRVHPLTERVMAEVGVDLSGVRPRHVDEILGVVPLRTVIIVCDGANKTCPAVPPGVYERLFWPFEDPAAFDGRDEEKLAKFREVRDSIERRVAEWVGARRDDAESI